MSSPGSGRPLVEGHPFRSVRAQPQGPTVPEVWILGTSDYGAQVAAHFGLPDLLRAFITDGAGAAEAMSLYRDSYKPSIRHPQPHGAVCVWAVAGETKDAAERLFSSRACGGWGGTRACSCRCPRPRKPRATTSPNGERAHVERLKERAIWGTAGGSAPGCALWRRNWMSRKLRS